ncbi:MAG: helix-turn-helix transcriptional regulator [Clostridia bacterium]|nr:helix-turn-helix transcriptional regulator [Clostridia bacterium]
MLADRHMTRMELQRAAEATQNTVTKMCRNQPVNLVKLDRICFVRDFFGYELAIPNTSG